MMAMKIGSVRNQRRYDEGIAGSSRSGRRVMRGPELRVGAAMSDRRCGGRGRPWDNCVKEGEGGGRGRRSRQRENSGVRRGFNMVGVGWSSCLRCEGDAGLQITPYFYGDEGQHPLCNNYPVWPLHNYERRSDIPQNTVMTMRYRQISTKKVNNSYAWQRGPN